MTTAKSGQDVFEMAIEMEQIGKEFYTALALGSDNTNVRMLCTALAKDEETHLAIFQNLRNKREKSMPGFKPTPETAGALAELVKSQVQPNSQAVRKVAIGGNLADAMDMAIAMEQDAINFYQRLMVNLPDSAPTIQSIVEQERKHLLGLKSVMG